MDCFTASARGRLFMHILMVAPQPFFRPRGTPFSVLHRLRGLSMLGHTVDLLTYPFGDSPVIPGVRILRSGRPPLVRDVGIGPSVAKLLLDIPLFREAAFLARTGCYDLVHTHEEAGWLGAWIRRKYGVPHLCDMHSSLPQQLGNFARYDWPLVRRTFERLESRALAGADAVIAICPELRDHIAASGYPGPLFLIENTLDFEPPPYVTGDALALRRAHDIGDDAPVILYTGTLEAYQGLDLLLAAAPAVLQEHAGARFVLVGGTRVQIAALQRTVAALGVADAFRFIPAVPPEDVFRFHHLSDVLVTTRSRGTNTPLKIYQYLRAGKPVVATDIRSHTQVLDSDTAELVAPTVRGVAAGIVRVLGDPVRARELAGNAARVAAEKYSEATYMDELERVMAAVQSGGVVVRTGAH
jgi:glycosyltransferase involved in cell wall biosynthesis